MAGGFMCVHLSVNASIINSPETFQSNVYGIHALGKILPLVEWAFIFAPLLFHAVVGVWIARTGRSNASLYGYGANYRYTLQRITGYVLFAFVLYHVFHMHGWFHFDWWLAIVKPLGGAAFAPYNASSTGGAALQNIAIRGVYAVGVLSGAYHMANGLWTAGITWGLWTTPKSQAGALKICSLFCAGIAVIGITGLFGMWTAGHPDNIDDVIAAENRMYDARVEAGSALANEHKRAGGHVESAGVESSDDDSTDQESAEH